MIHTIFSVCFKRRSRLYEKETIMNNKIISAIKEADDKHIIKESFYDNGQIESRKSYKKTIFNGWYKNPVLDGMEEYWYENGRLNSQVNYKNGKRDGLCQGWFEDGKLSYKTYLIKDKIEGVCENYNEDGTLRYRINYKHGKEHGLAEYSYDSGELLHRGTYKNGKEHGIIEYFYKNGNLSERWIYKDGNIDGKCESWLEDGTLSKVEIYKHGELVNHIPYDRVYDDEFWNNYKNNKGKKSKVKLSDDEFTKLMADMMVRDLLGLNG